MPKSKSNSKQISISKKVISSFEKFINQKTVDISDLREAKIKAEDFEKTIISEKRLLELDPLHGVYTYAQNRISVLIEQLSELPALRKLSEAYTDAEDTYFPSGPPMSPLTTSYFSFWGFFDLCTGIKRETFGTVAIDVGKFLTMDQGLIKIFEIMQDSRMGFYIHEGSSKTLVSLRELITGKQIKTIVPSGYVGQPGETWLARVLPEPFPELNFGYSVVVTAPYIITEQIDNNDFGFAREENWLDFFDRNLKKTGIKDKISAYEFFMKYGLETHYWNEYIFEAYANHQHDMILLAGFPDIPLSRPHSMESQQERGEL